MFSFRRKIRAAHAMYLWGAPQARSGFGERLVLCIQVEENGDAVTVTTARTWLHFWRACDDIELGPGDVYAVDLRRALYVRARCKEGGDAFLQCALASPR